MPQPESPRITRVGVLRVLGFALGVALGAVAVWLIVTSKTQKTLELGVLAGIWGAVFAWFAITRRAAHPDPAVAVDASYGALELRSRATTVESAADVARRRADEQQLQEFLRLEIRQSVGREVVTLRDEIERLRTELLEKVGGQLRLEHIETTRVIGSDLEALQSEIRSLKATARDPLGGLRPGGPRQPARVLDSSEPVDARAADATLVEREVVDRAVIGSPVVVPAEPAPQAQPAQQPAQRPAAASGPQPVPGFTDPLPRLPRSPVVGNNPLPPPGTRDTGFVTPVPSSADRQPPPIIDRQVSPVAPFSSAPPARFPSPPASSVPFDRLPTLAGSRTEDDPFARMPRLSPFVDDAPTPPPAPPAAVPSPQPSFGAPVTPAHTSDVDPTYAGRRRMAGTTDGAKGDRPGEGGRRRRVEGQNADNLLAKLLEREGY